MADDTDQTQVASADDTPVGSSLPVLEISYKPKQFKDPSQMTDEEMQAEIGASQPRQKAAPQPAAPAQTKVAPPASPFGTVRGEPQPTALKDPSQMTDEEIKAELAASSPEAQKEQTKQLIQALQTKADIMETGGPGAATAMPAVTSSFINAATLNLARNARALALAYKNGTSFADQYAKEKAYDEAVARLHPYLSTASGIAGGLASAPFLPTFGMGKAGVMAAEEAPGLIRSALSSGLTSGIYGGISGGLGEHTLGGAGSEALKSAGLGAALGPVINKALTTASSRSLYRPTDSAGNLTQDAENAIRAIGLDPTTKPQNALNSILNAFRAKGISPAAAREGVSREFGVPLTRGQALADPNAIAKEQMMETMGPVGQFLGKAQPEQVATSQREFMGPNAPSDYMEAARQTEQNVIQAHQAAHDAAQAQYDAEFSKKGIFDANAVRSMASSIEQKMQAANQVIDPDLNPAASKALKDMDDKLGSLNIKNQLGSNPTPAQMKNVVGINMKGMDQIRKRLRMWKDKATSPDDKRLVGQMIEHFDDHVEDAVANGYFSGDSSVLPGLKQARKMWANYKQTYSPQSRDHSSRIMDDIVHGRLNAATIASHFINDSQVGVKQVAPNLWNKMERAFGKGSPELETVKDMMKSKLTTPQRKFETNPKAQAKDVSDRIDAFLKAKGSDLAEKAFSPSERSDLARYSSHMRNIARLGKANIEAETAKTIKRAGLHATAVLAPALAAARAFPGSELAAAAIGHLAANVVNPMLAKRAANIAAKTALSGAPRMINRKAIALTPGVLNNAPGLISGGAQILGNILGNAFATPARAKGGRVEAEQLGKEAERANKSLGGSLKPLMNMPDEDIVNALRLTKTGG